MGRAPCCEKVGLNRGPWTHEEDMRLIQYIQAQGEGCWRTLPKAAGLLRCGKSCRLRWINYLRPDLKRGNISEEEDKLIIKLHSMLGNRWSLIAGRLPGRTDNEIKNYWNTHLKKKLRNMGIDPQTHLPLLQDNPSSNTTTRTCNKVTSNPTLLDNASPFINKKVHSLAHGLNTSLITSNTRPKSKLFSHHNKLMNKSVLSFEAKPLDQYTSPIHALEQNSSTKTLKTRSYLDSSNLPYSPLNYLTRATENSITHTNSSIRLPFSSTLDTTLSTRDNPPSHKSPLSASYISPFNVNNVNNSSPHGNSLTSCSLSSTSTCMLDHLPISNNLMTRCTLASSSSSSITSPSSSSSTTSSSSSVSTTSPPSSLYSLSSTTSSFLSSFSSSPPLSTSLLSFYALASPTMGFNTTSPQIEIFSTTQEELYPKTTSEKSTKNESLMSHIHSSPMPCSSFLTGSSMLSTVLPSQALSLDVANGYRDKCDDEEAIEHAISCHDNEGTSELMENPNLFGLTTNDTIVQEPKPTINKGEGSDDESYNTHENILKECGLRLMEGELMWDMEMIHSIEDISTPTRASSMITCPSYSLWGHDVAYDTNDASPLFNVQHDQ